MKKIFAGLLLASGLSTGWASSFSGPTGNGGDLWQIPALGYGQSKAAKNISEEYRRNVPVFYYAFDANFYGFFGTNGASDVDQALAMLNSLTNVDNYSHPLTEFPLAVRHKNYLAEALGLWDLKTQVLGGMTEQLGLANPVQYSWILHDRFGGPVCPVDMEYFVVQRNFDFVSSNSLNQILYSPYINNVLYSYDVLEYCPPATPVAVTSPYSVDPLADEYSPVAAWQQDYPGMDIIFTAWGDYFTGLTRDDMATLRYLISTNNVNWEIPAADSLFMTTNTAFQEPFPVSATTNMGVLFNGAYYGTSPLFALLSFASTNDSPALQAAYPDLQFTQTGSYLTNVLVTNVVAYYTNLIGAATSPSLVVRTNVSQVIIRYYQYTFDNIVTNIYGPITIGKRQTLTVGPLIGAAADSGALATNTTTKNVTNNFPAGEFYILPTNSPCGVHIIATLQTFTNYYTNVLVSTAASTNGATLGPPASTNAPAGTNASASYTIMDVTPFVGHVYVINPLFCQQTTNPPAGLYRGIGQMRFIRADYDSLVGQYWRPITNDYTMVMITNSQERVMNFRRIVTEPDFLYSAEDMTAGGALNIERRNVTFETNGMTLPGLAGPGTIITPTTTLYSKTGPVYYNAYLDTMNGTPYFTSTPPGADQTNLFYAAYVIWASYDGTTNAPVVYPNGTSMENLVNQMLVQVTPSTLPNAYVGIPLTPAITFTVKGGAFSAPFTWSANGLPPGLTLSSTGVLSGKPTRAGVFDFTLTLVDSLARSVQWTYSMEIQ